MVYICFIMAVYGIDGDMGWDGPNGRPGNKRNQFLCMLWRLVDFETRKFNEDITTSLARPSIYL
jgi:hypothetical protein